MHSTEYRWQRFAGALAALFLLGASMVMNWQYGFSLGTTSVSQWVYGGAAASADVLMALMPFFFFAGWRSREYLRCLGAAIVWIITTVFAAQSAIGHAALNRLDVMSQRAVISTNYQDVRTDLAQARKDRGFVPTHRPDATVRAEIEKLKTERLWHITEECQSIAGKPQRDLCSRFQTLNAELGYSLQASRLDSRIEALQEKSDKASTTNATTVASEADPQARFISIWSGSDLRTVQGFLTLIVVLMILTCANLGLYVSLSSAPIAKAPEPQPEPEPLTTPRVEPMKALPAPIRTSSRDKAITVRAEPTAEWRDLLTSIDFPPLGSRHKGPLRAKDKREHVALRFVCWLAAYREAGEFTADSVTELYDEFHVADHKEPWGERIVKSELEALGKKIASKRQGEGTTLWTVTPPPMERLVALLQKAGALPKPEDKAASPEAAQDTGRSTAAAILPFDPSAAGSVAEEPPRKPANENAPRTQAEIAKGLWAKFGGRMLPDWERGQWAVGRLQKAAFQVRVPNRKSLNRLSRIRAA